MADFPVRELVHQPPSAFICGASFSGLPFSEALVNLFIAAEAIRRQILGGGYSWPFGLPMNHEKLLSGWCVGRTLHALPNEPLGHEDLQPAGFFNRKQKTENRKPKTFHNWITK
jgi:hypothetical protein